jgi:hypothetical protein
VKDATDKILFVIYGLFGSVLGLLIFMFALGGWNLVFTGRATSQWNGIGALIVCCALGGGWGFVSYLLKNREFASGSSSLFRDPASAILFSKRLMVVATSIAGAYFIWQVAKSI